MTNSREFTGKTTEEAISKGLMEMGVSRSDVKIETLQEGSKGLFGLFGSRPARVRITLNEEDFDAKDMVRDLFSSAGGKQEKPQGKPAPAPKNEKKPEPAPAEETEAAERRNENGKKKPADEQPEGRRPEGKKAEGRKPEGKKNEGRKPEGKRPEGKNPEDRKPEKKNDGKGEGAEGRGEGRRKSRGEGRKKPAAPQEPRVPRPPVEQLDPATKAGQAQAFLQELTRLMGVEVTVEVSTDEEGNIRVDMEGDTLGILIGRRGETLDALQYLTSLRVNKGQNEYTRVTLDTEHYRAKREEALIRLANRMANRVVKTGRKVSMEPMNPYERRILHSALQNNEFVTTHSEGEEPNRHVVITPKKAEKGEKTLKPAKARAESPAAENAADASETDVTKEEGSQTMEAAAEITETAVENTETAAENV